jgi:hypothetical protein
MKTFLTVWIVLLDLIHTADGATNDTTAVKPSRPPLIVAVERGDRGAVEKLLRDGADVEVRTAEGVVQVTDADTLSEVREALNLSELGLLPLRWDPLRMVNRIRHAAFLRLKHPEAMARRAIVTTLADDPLHTVANADSEHPEIITRTGNELTVVRLKRDALGRYDLEAFEWLVAKLKGH